MFHEVDQQLVNRDELLLQLKMNLGKAINWMKQMADQKRQDLEFKVGDWVLLKLHPYRQQSTFERVSLKLYRKFYGPIPN